MPSPKRILFVDDDPALLKVMHDKFIGAGFGVITARSGKEGLEKALRERPDLIALDILMPQMNGLEVLRNLRKDPWGASAKVVLLTNSEDDKIIEEGVKLGASEYLLKVNWNIGDLTKAFHTIIGNS